MVAPTIEMQISTSTAFVPPPFQPVITLSNAAAPITKAGGQQAVPVVISDETARAMVALAGHINLIESVAGWKRIPPDHKHPRLLSEPDD